MGAESTQRRSTHQIGGGLMRHPDPNEPVRLLLSTSCLRGKCRTCPHRNRRVLYFEPAPERDRRNPRPLRWMGRRLTGGLTRVCLCPCHEKQIDWLRVAQQSSDLLDFLQRMGVAEAWKTQPWLRKQKHLAIFVRIQSAASFFGHRR